ncbi:hypothetical protein ACLKA7_008150 [Drosophila subpalustris]
MDKDRSKFNSNASGRAAKCSKCTKPDTCIHLRTLRQQQLEKISSTQVLHVVRNFRENRSDEDIFFDCMSTGDSDFAQAGNSCKSSSGRSNGKSSGQGPSTSESSRFDDPEALRAALERIAEGTQMMLKNFEQSKSGCRKSCNATLEITARLITDSKDNGPNCRFQGRPVTMKMPLEFDPSTGQLGTKSAASSSRHICEKPCSRSRSQSQSQISHPGRVLSQHQQQDYQQQTSCVSEAETQDDVFEGSCTPTLASNSQQPMKVPLPVPGLIPAQSQSEPEPEPEPESDVVLESLWEPEQLPESDGAETLLESEVEEAPTPKYKKPLEAEDTPRTSKQKPLGTGRYFMALPQHRDFSNCSPCRFSPSPIMDEAGNVFCPGNCGCCQCAWKRRSFADNRDHINVKVCRCVQRGTIFSSFADRETCSQTSYFDFCPCREKAEAKYLELYNREMWSSANATRGPEVQLNQIKELTVPPQPRS